MSIPFLELCYDSIKQTTKSHGITVPIGVDFEETWKAFELFGYKYGEDAL